ncbi:MAG: CpsD/CapB family tyrosine-protein kinase, partial [Acidobacteriales bacterium]|nr:CpsD/CapB family tyrosine-protein kinase [Terriglobales bacterium]
RRPCLHQVFELNGGGGLVAYLTGQSEWMAAVMPTTYAGLDVLISGPVPPNPAELLSSERMRRLLFEACAAYDFVVLDSPPLINLADARILASLVDGVVLVLKGGATTRDMARRARHLASAVGANVLGLVLNRLDSSFGDYHYYQGDYPPEPSEAHPEDVEKV